MNNDETKFDPHVEVIEPGDDKPTTLTVKPGDIIRVPDREVKSRPWVFTIVASLLLLCMVGGGAWFIGYLIERNNALRDNSVQLYEQLLELGESPDGQNPDTIEGPAGLDGPQGERGERGYRGETGERGERGFRGPTGPNGPKGETGPVGPAGEDGAPGVAGATGIPGADGLNGQDGAPGPQGETGAQGPAGEKGATGDRGPQGDTGAEGPTGPMGPQGPQGDPGPDGTVMCPGGGAPFTVTVPDMGGNPVNVLSCG